MGKQSKIQSDIIKSLYFVPFGSATYDERQNSVRGGREGNNMEYQIFWVNSAGICRAYGGQDQPLDDIIKVGWEPYLTLGWETTQGYIMFRRDRSKSGVPAPPNMSGVMQRR